MPQRPCSEALFGGTVGGSGGCGGEGGRRAAGNGGEEVLCCSVALLPASFLADRETMQVRREQALWDVNAGRGSKGLGLGCCGTLRQAQEPHEGVR